MPAIVRIGDPVSCGDVMAEGSGNVFANGIPVSREGIDNTAGHCFPPVPVTSGSTTTVFTNHIPTDRVGDPISPHCCGDSCHGGNMANGSPNVFVDEFWGPTDAAGDRITQEEFNENISFNQTNPELPDEISYETVQQDGECTEGYMTRAGNSTGQMENGIPPANKISNINIPTNCLDVDTQMLLTEGSPTEPAPTNVAWSWTPVPPGLTMSADGHITGTLTTPGEYSVTVTATNTDTSQVVDEKNFKISAVECTEGSTVTFIHPLPGSILTSKVNPARSINGGKPRPHRGCDFAYAGGAIGNVLAAAGGVVLFAGVKSGYGNVVCIGHMNANNEQVAVTLYAHLASYSVSVGQSVDQGAIIGVEGNTGIGTGAHLHFEIRGPNYISNGNPLLNQNAKVYDPMVYINGNVELDTGIINQAYTNNTDIDSGVPTNSTTTITNNNSIPAGTTPCEQYDTTPTQDVSGMDPTDNATGPATVQEESSCAGPTPNKEDVIAAIDAVLDTHPELDAEDRKFIHFVARVESNYNNYAKNPTSSATGLYQFLTSLANAYGLFTCEDRCDIELSTEAMISFYKNEIRTYYNGWVSSGYTTIAGKPIVSTPHSARYQQLSKTVWCYGLIHHDGVGNAVKGIDKQGVEYAERRLAEFSNA